jgi:general stress protein YciG
MSNENDRHDRDETNRDDPGGGPSSGRGEHGHPGGPHEKPAAHHGAGEHEKPAGAGETPSRTTATVEGSEQPRKKQRRGFAAMDPEKQRAIASKGGKASHAAGTGHEWDSESAREAGRKGGQASRGGRGKLRSETPSGGEGGGTPGAGI